MIETIYFDAGGILFDTPTNRYTRIFVLLTAKGFKHQEIERAIKKAELFSKHHLSEIWLDDCLKEDQYWYQYYQILVEFR